ncbi:MATE family efflux transporter [Streptomyces sp. NPDC007162]|uniref:MATE family efflux transporter n=1 Tax=Streptomyces sp. NPDC007162 TaxID=3156917 RepID=UPI0033F99125
MSGDARPVGAYGLWPLALPLLGELLIIAFGTFSEVFFLGRVGLDAVAAYGIVAPVLLLCIVFLRLSAQGAGAVLSRYRGSGDMGRVAVGQRLALAVSTVLGLVLAGGLAGLSEQIFSLMGASGQILVYAQQYALGWSLVIAVMSVRFPVAAFASSYGNTRWALVSNVTGTAVAVTLNASLVHWYVHWSRPALWVALAVAAGYLTNLIVLVVLARPSFVRSASRTLGELREIAREMARVVVPGTLDPVQFNVLLILMTTIVASFGSDQLAARAYATQVASFVFMYSLALAQASQILVSRAFGAGDFAGAKRLLNMVSVRSVGGAVVLAVLAVIGVWLGIGQLTTSHEVARLTIALILLGLVLEPARSLNITTNLSLVAIGDGRFVLTVGIGLSWLVGLPIAYLLGRGVGWGVVGVWIAVALDESIRAAIGLWRWRALNLGALQNVTALAESSATGVEVRE